LAQAPGKVPVVTEEEKARRRADLDRLGPPEYRMQLWAALASGEYGGGRPRPTRHERGEENVSPVEDRGAVEAVPIELDEEARALLARGKRGKNYPPGVDRAALNRLAKNIGTWRAELKRAAKAGDLSRYDMAKAKLRQYVEERRAIMERARQGPFTPGVPVSLTIEPERWRYSVGALGPVEVSSIEAVLTGLEDYLKRDGEPFDREQVEARLQALIPGESYVDDDDRFAVVRLEPSDTKPTPAPLYRSEFNGIVKGHELRDFLTGIEAHMMSWPDRRFRVEVRVERVAG